MIRAIVGTTIASLLLVFPVNAAQIVWVAQPSDGDLVYWTAMTEWGEFCVPMLPGEPVEPTGWILSLIRSEVTDGYGTLHRADFELLGATADGTLRVQVTTTGKSVEDEAERRNYLSLESGSEDRCVRSSRLILGGEQATSPVITLLPDSQGAYEWTWRLPSSFPVGYLTVRITRIPGTNQFTREVQELK